MREIFICYCYVLLTIILIASCFTYPAQGFFILGTQTITKNYQVDSENIFKVIAPSGVTDKELKKYMKGLLKKVYKSDVNRKTPKEVATDFSIEENKLWKFHKESGQSLTTKINIALSCKLTNTLETSEEQYTLEDADEAEKIMAKASKAYRDNQTEMNKKRTIKQEKIPDFTEHPTSFRKLLFRLIPTRFPIDLLSLQRRYQNTRSNSHVTSHYLWVGKEPSIPIPLETMNEPHGSEETNELLNVNTNL